MAYGQPADGTNKGGFWSFLKDPWLKELRHGFWTTKRSRRTKNRERAPPFLIPSVCVKLSFGVNPANMKGLVLADTSENLVASAFHPEDDEVIAIGEGGRHRDLFDLMTGNLLRSLGTFILVTYLGPRGLADGLELFQEILTFLRITF